MSLKPIILWDMNGNSILSRAPDYRRFFIAGAHAARQLGHKCTWQEMMNVWNANAPKWEKSFEMLDIKSQDEYWQLDNLMHQYLLDEFKGSVFYLNHDMVKIKKQMEESHHHILVTHAPKMWSDYWLELAGLKHMFEHVYNIKTLGLCKRNNAETYQYVIDDLAKKGVSSNKIYMVEDSEGNLPHAESSGIIPVLYTPKQSSLGYKNHTCINELHNIFK